MQLKENQSFSELFSQDDFSVDVFLQTYSGIHTLEDLRNKLSKHLKELETKMIDIVNSESDTILSLSSSLNGLDIKIANLSSLLGQLKEEILLVMNTIEDHLGTVDKLLEYKKEVNTEKENYINMLQALKCCSRIRKILNSTSRSLPVPGYILLRAVDQYILQEIHLKKCDKSELSLMEKQDLESVSQLVLDNLQMTFLKSIEDKNKEEVSSCLKMATYLNKEIFIETLVRKSIVSPKLSRIINEKSLQRGEKSLIQLYSEIISFINSDMELLLSLTAKNNKEQITGYNFVLNSIWVDADEKLRVNLSSIFAPGNPSSFQKNFNHTMNFISHLVTLLESEIDSNMLYDHETYKMHMQKWNLPVYFQIRFNEIATTFEIMLLNEVTEMLQDNKEFRLKSSETLWKSIQRCLDKDVFIPNLTHRFWKLILQFLSRYLQWVDEIINKEGNVQVLDIDQKTYDTKVKFFVYLYLDIKFITEQLSSLNISIIPVNMHELINSQKSTVNKTFCGRLEIIQNVLSKIISDHSSTALKQVLHIPRLFRKTNRSVPTEPAHYVEMVLEPPMTFQSIYMSLIKNDVCQKLMADIYLKITKEYYTVLDELLTQVQKTEDSLRRLKKSQSRQTQSDSIGDDQKIRIQLQLDVTHYCNEVQKISNDVDLAELKNLVKEVK